jgi:hypothetical protein
MAFRIGDVGDRVDCRRSDREIVSLDLGEI